MLRTPSDGAISPDVTRRGARPFRLASDVSTFRPRDDLSPRGEEFFAMIDDSDENRDAAARRRLRRSTRPDPIAPSSFARARSATTPDSVIRTPGHLRPAPSASIGPANADARKPPLGRQPDRDTTAGST
jgi:hypothetical protein